MSPFGRFLSSFRRSCSLQHVHLRFRTSGMELTLELGFYLAGRQKKIFR